MCVCVCVTGVTTDGNKSSFCLVVKSEGRERVEREREGEREGEGETEGETERLKGEGGMGDKWV